MRKLVLVLSFVLPLSVFAGKEYSDYLPEIENSIQKYLKDYQKDGGLSAQEMEQFRIRVEELLIVVIETDTNIRSCKSLLDSQSLEKYQTIQGYLFSKTMRECSIVLTKILKDSSPEASKQIATEHARTVCFNVKTPEGVVFPPYEEQAAICTLLSENVQYLEKQNQLEIKNNAIAYAKKIKNDKERSIPKIIPGEYFKQMKIK